MGSIGDVFSGIKQLLLIEDKVARLERDVVNLADDLRRTRDYADSIDKRVTHLEGFIAGAAAASGRPTQLPAE